MYGAPSILVRGSKLYELSNHLGNVLATITDKKIGIDDGAYAMDICPGCAPALPSDPPTVCEFCTFRRESTVPDLIIDYYIADVVTANDYYPFGMVMPGRKYLASNSYRYGFNGKENDNEVKGEDNQVDYGMRVYDPRLCKFLSVDPLTKNYPWYSPYQYAGNNPIKFIDLDGLEPFDPSKKKSREN